MTLEKMQTELGLQTLPDRFAGIYENIRDLWKNRSKEILSDTYIRCILEENRVLTDRLQLILDAAAQVRENPAMCLLVCLLEQWIKADTIPENGFKGPVGTGLAYDFLHLFAAIPTIPESVAYLQNRGLPADVIADTMAEYDYCVQLCENSLGARPLNLAVFGGSNALSKISLSILIDSNTIFPTLMQRVFRSMRILPVNCRSLPRVCRSTAPAVFWAQPEWKKQPAVLRPTSPKPKQP